MYLKFYAVNFAGETNQFICTDVEFNYQEYFAYMRQMEHGFTQKLNLNKRKLDYFLELIN